MVREHGKGFRSHPMVDVINGGRSSVVRGGGRCLGVAKGARMVPVASREICESLGRAG